MPNITIRPARPRNISVKPSSGGSIVVNGVQFELIDGHILNLKGQISVGADGIIEL